MSLVHHIVAGIALVLVLDHFNLLAGVGFNPSGSAINGNVPADVEIGKEALPTLSR